MREGKKRGKCPVANFHDAFTHGHRFQRDQCVYEMEVVDIGKLCLPTGKIVAADPGNLDDRVTDYFEREVPPGSYPVDITIRHTENSNTLSKYAETACMRIRFSKEPIIEWTIATTKDQNPEELPPFQIFGFGVDVGMASFADSSGLVAIFEHYSAQSKTLYEEFYFERVLPAYEATDARKADILLDPETGSNLVLCSSGAGDGFYASYWGLSAEGNPVCLVADFGLLTHHVHATTEIGRLSELLGRETRLQLPGGMLQLSISMPEQQKLIIEAHGEASSTADFEVRNGGEPIRLAGSTFSFGETGRKIEMTFPELLMEDLLLTVTHIDRIESM